MDSKKKGRLIPLSFLGEAERAKLLPVTISQRFPITKDYGSCRSKLNGIGPGHELICVALSGFGIANLKISDKMFPDASIL